MSSSYIGRSVDAIDNISTLDNLSFNGSDATFNLTQNGVAFTPVSADALQIQIDGIIQSGNFSVSSSTVTFDFTPNSGSVCNSIKHFGVGIITQPSDGSVTTAKLGADSVNGSKIADNSISDEHLDITAITGQTEKTSLADADKFLISDSASSGALKYVQKSNLGGGAMTLLEQKIGTADVTNLVFENKFSNTYTRYIIYIDYMYNGTTNTHLRYKFRKSDGSGGYEDETRTGYTYTIAGRRHGADEFDSVSSGGATDFGRLTPMITRSGGEHGLKAVLEIYRPGTVGSQACMTYVQARGMYRSYVADSSMAAHFNSSSNNYHTDAFLGIKLYFSSGNVDDYKVTLYGVTT